MKTKSPLTILVWAVGILSTILSTVFLIQNRSLFLDSLNLARNICDRNFSGLIAPLDYQQSAPLLFLWLSEAITSVFGYSEFTFRILPFIFGVLGLYVIYKVALRYLNRPWAIGVLLFVGTHLLYVRYSTEYKQYIGDVFVTLFLIYYYLKITKIDQQSWWKIAFVWMLSIWLSMPSIFVIAAIFIHYFMKYRGDFDKRYVGILVAFVGLNFLANYYFILSPASDSSHMQNFHEVYFFRYDIWNLEAINQNINHIVSLMRMIVGKSGLAIGLGLASVFIAIYHWVKTKHIDGLLLLLPICFSIGASLIGKYSMVQRLMLFTLPLFVIIIFYGCTRLWQSKWMRPVILLVLVVSYIQTSAWSSLYPKYELEDNRSAIEYLAQYGSDKGVHPVVCTNLSVASFDYYVNCRGTFDKDDFGELIKTEWDTDLVKTVSQMSQDGPVWMYLNHTHTEDRNAFADQLGNEVSIIERKEWEMSGLFLCKKH